MRGTYPDEPLATGSWYGREIQLSLGVWPLVCPWSNRQPQPKHMWTELNVLGRLLNMREEEKKEKKKNEIKLKSEHVWKIGEIEG